MTLKIISFDLSHQHLSISRICAEAAGASKQTAHDGLIRLQDIVNAGEQQTLDKEDAEGVGKCEAEFLSSISNRYTETEDIAEPVNDDLVLVLNDLFAKRFSDDNAKQLLEDYKRPENVEVASTLINPEIWTNVGAERRSADVKLLIRSGAATETYCGANQNQSNVYCEADQPAF